MKKSVVIFVLILLAINFVSATNYYTFFDTNANNSDVANAISFNGWALSSLNVTFVSFEIAELDKEKLDNALSVYFKNGKALVFISDTAPSQDSILAIEISSYLSKICLADRNRVIIILASELNSDTLENSLKKYDSYFNSNLNNSQCDIQDIDLIVEKANLIRNSYGVSIEFTIKNSGKEPAKSSLTEQYRQIGVYLTLNGREMGHTIVPTDSEGFLLGAGESVNGSYGLIDSQFMGGEEEKSRFIEGVNYFELFVDRTYDQGHVYLLPNGYIKETNETNNIFMGSFDYYFPSDDSTVIELPDNSEYPQNEVTPSNEDENNIGFICQGCILDNKCYPFGFRKDNNYCDDSTSNFISQKVSDSSCENNFECDSNLCINSQCVSGSVWAKFVRWFKRLFG